MLFYPFEKWENIIVDSISHNKEMCYTWFFKCTLFINTKHEYELLGFGLKIDVR